MTTRIVFYKTDIDEKRLMIIQHIENFLSTCDSWRYPYMEVQYIKPSYNITLTLDLTGLMEFEFDNPVSQDVLYDLGYFPYDYLEIQNATEGNSWSRKYYFVSSYDWASKNTIRINLTLDVLNTYLSVDAIEDIFLTNTQIIREHRDRFIKNQSHYDSPHDTWEVVRMVDKENENIELPKFGVYEVGDNPFNLPNKEIINPDFPGSWYLIYKNTEYKPGQINEKYPIEAFTCYDEPLLLSKSSLPDNPEKGLLDLFKNHMFYNTDIYVLNQYSEGEVTSNFKCYRNGVYTEFLSTKDKVYVITFVAVGFYVTQLNYTDGVYVSQEEVYSDSDVNNITMTNCEILYYREWYTDGAIRTNLTDVTSKYPSKLINAGKKPGVFIKGIKNIDITDVKNVKIIKLPYAPMEVKMVNGVLSYDTTLFRYEPDEGNDNIGLLKAYNVTNDFYNPEIVEEGTTHVLEDMLAYPIQQVSGDDDFNYFNESKLLNSEFTELKLMYDNIEYNLPLEYNEFYIMSDVITPDFRIGFKPTNTINSNFLFVFNDLKTCWQSPLAYQGIMTIKRNNETTLFNSQYINYVNNGYNYDKKHQKMDLATGVIGNAIGLAGQGVAMATGGITGSAGVLGAKFGSSLINDAMSTITSAVKSEDAIRQRLTDMNNASVNVSGSDDIDLLSFYNNNKLWFKAFSIRDSLKRDIAYLFHLIGYSYPYKDIPDFHTRLWFNFVQCKPVFDEVVIRNFRIPHNFLEIIREKFEGGVTYFHDVNGKWDITQTRENYEIWLTEV